MDAGGCTDLSSGYLRGLQEVQRLAGPTGATLLLVSDGHANAGVTDPIQLGQVATRARTKNVTTTTLGFGYKEQLLAPSPMVAAAMSTWPRRPTPPSPSSPARWTGC